MKSKVLCVSVVTILSVGIWLTVGQQTANAQARHVRWDIIFFAPVGSGFGFFPGGTLSATASDNVSQISLTGTGTFVQPASGKGTSNAVTGGGTWATNGPGRSASGTYTVTGFVQYAFADGTLAGSGLVDNIGDIRDTHAGLAIFSILYSDGERGTLVISCNLGPQTPAIVYEGAHATKGFVDYFAPVLPGDPNATMFHFAE